MADWPPWLWAVIGIVALIIVIAIIFGIRGKDVADPDVPFIDDDLDAQTPAHAATPTHPVAEEDEETLTGPLAYPTHAVEEVVDDIAAPAPEPEPAASDDDVPRDDEGRRLDPYGNPVD